MFTSATKLVLIMMVLTVCLGLFNGVVDSKDYINALLMVLAFYFGRSNPTPPSATAGM